MAHAHRMNASLTAADGIPLTLQQAMEEWKRSTQTPTSKTTAHPPTAVHLYQIGGLLATLRRKMIGDSTLYRDLRQALHQVLQSLPSAYRITLFTELKQAFLRVVTTTTAADTADASTATHNNSNVKNSSSPSSSSFPSSSCLSIEAVEAVHALAELYEASPLAAHATEWSMDDLTQLVTLYHAYHKTMRLSSPPSDTSDDNPVLSILSHWVWTKSLPWEELIVAIHTLQQEEEEQEQQPTTTAAATQTTVLWDDLYQWQNDHKPGWIDMIQWRYPDQPEVEQYLLSFIKSPTLKRGASPPEMSDTISDSSNALRSPVRRSTTTTTSHELQRRIDQIRQVFSTLGEGFVEICLNYYKGDVEATVAALMDNDADPPVPLPAALQYLDRNLPRHRRGTPTSLDAEEDAATAGDGSNKVIRDKQEVRALTKATLEAYERQQEEEAYMVDMILRQDAHDEYNDDYDDQFDACEGVAVTLEKGVYDDNNIDCDSYDAIRTYNRVLKGIESEQSFWEGHRNTNRMSPAAKARDASGNKIYRGPDKGRGGRIPGRNGGRGRSSGRGGGRRGPSFKDDGSANPSHGHAPTAGDTNQSSGATSQDSNNVGNKIQKSKARKIADRKNQQKKALAKRSVG